MKLLFHAYEPSWHTKEDDAFMQSPAWKQIRLKILKRDGYTCQHCGFKAEKGMNVNHIDGNPKNNSDSNLEVICPDCHKIMHAGLWVVIKKTMRLYRKSKFRQSEIISIKRDILLRRSKRKQLGIEPSGNRTALGFLPLLPMSLRLYSWHCSVQGSVESIMEFFCFRYGLTSDLFSLRWTHMAVIRNQFAKIADVVLV